MPQEAPHNIPDSMWQHGLLTSLIIETIPSLFRWVDGPLVLYFPPPLDSGLAHHGKQVLSNLLYTLTPTLRCQDMGRRWKQ